MVITARAGLVLVLSLRAFNSIPAGLAGRGVAAMAGGGRPGLTPGARSWRGKRLVWAAALAALVVLPFWFTYYVAVVLPPS
jgi:hypothetical protein